MAKTPKTPLKPETRLVTAGRDTEAQHGFVNPPVYHASTVLYPTAEDQVAHRARYQYGRRGTPTSEALERRLRELEGEGCAGVALLPSGLAAISTALLAVAGAGDHILVTDSVYRPTRNFCDGMFKRMGVETTYYDPLIGAGIATAVQAEHARGVRRGARLAELRDAGHSGDRQGRARQRRAGADGQYLGDAALFPAPSTRASISRSRPAPNISAAIPTSCSAASRPMRATLPKLKDAMNMLGLCVGPDDMYLALRGLRTHRRAAGAASSNRACTSRAGSSSRPEVARVLHPALESDPGHAIWKRDFTGACGLFSIVLKPASQQAVYAFMDALALFGMGYSWGGFESLVILVRLRRVSHRDANGRRAGRRCASISGWKIRAT